MARIEKRKNKRRVSYLATVRRKGFKAVARTFDTKGEAIVWAAGIEQDMRDRRYQDPRLALGITLDQAMDRYLKTISTTKAKNTQMREKACAKRLLERIGAETPLGAIDANIVATYRDERMQGKCLSIRYVSNLYYSPTCLPRRKKNGEFQWAILLQRSNGHHLPEDEHGFSQKMKP